MTISSIGFLLLKYTIRKIKHKIFQGFSWLIFMSARFNLKVYSTPVIEKDIYINYNSKFNNKKLCQNSNLKSL